MQEIVSVTTSKKEEMIDITSLVNAVISKSGVNKGLCLIYAMHSTAAVIINENADPNICLDIQDAMDKLIPQGAWRHDALDGNAAAHIKAAILGPCKMMPIKDGQLLLGTWQSPMLVEFDGPRKARQVAVHIQGE